MRLKDAGPNADQSRMKRASVVMESFLDRVPVDLYLLSVVACYNGAKPVVVDTKDLEVVRNIFGDLPMHYAFPVGKTDLFSGLAEAARIAHPWQPRSTLLLMLSDGDTVPGRRDAQDAGLDRRRPDRGRRATRGKGRSSTAGCRARTPRRSARSPPGSAGSITTATRSTSARPLIQGLTVIPRQGAFERLTRREYALIACGLGAAMLAFLPVLLHYFGTRWRPGVRISATTRPAWYAEGRAATAVAVGEYRRDGPGHRARNESIRFPIGRPIRYSTIVGVGMAENEVLVTL